MKGSILFATGWAAAVFFMLVFLGGWPATSKEVLVFVPMLWCMSFLIGRVVSSHDKEIRRRREIIEKRRRENGW